jgi:pimeloyl-ACP methyl ester carboxylesterase
MVVGHSGGGLLARLALCDAPYRGRIGGASGRVAALVSLGSPHDLHLVAGAAHGGVHLARFLATHEPGAFHAPRTGYLTVASDRIRGVGRPHSMPGRARAAFFETIVGPPSPDGSDGIVSVEHAHLPGARQLTFPDILHGVVGGPWYGDEVAIDRWWPIALSTWRDALQAREADAVSTRTAQDRGSATD